MQIKNTTKRTRKSLKSRQLNDLAFHLSAIMNNPETPDGLYNAIGDEITAYADSVDWNGAEMIAMALKGRLVDEKAGLYPVSSRKEQVIESHQVS